MSSREVRVGLVVTHHGRRGIVRYVKGNGAGVEFDDEAGVVDQIEATELRIPLHDGVLTSDESLEEWRAGKVERDQVLERLREIAREAERKRIAGLGSDAYDVAKAFGAPDIPDEVKKAIGDMRLYAPLAKLLPTQSDTFKEIIDFIAEAAILLATFFGVK